VVFVVYEDTGEVGNHYMVRNIMTVPLDSLAAAECRDVRVESEALYWCDMARLAVAVFVQDTGGGILQATLAG
jgi:hypothetical protein